jgi:hypothetical protein
VNPVRLLAAGPVRAGIVPDHVIECLVSRTGEQAKFNLAVSS